MVRGALDNVTISQLTDNDQELTPGSLYFAIRGTRHDGHAFVEKALSAGAVRVCAFLDKPSRREVQVDVEFTGFTLQGYPFVVGYGLDFAERYRNLPFVGVLRPRTNSR